MYCCIYLVHFGIVMPSTFFVVVPVLEVPLHCVLQVLAVCSNRFLKIV